MKSRKKILVIPIVIAALIICFCAVTYIFAPLFMVRPNFNKDAYSELKSISCAGEINIGEGLWGWYIDAAPGDDLIIYFGGISDDASASALMLYRLMEEGSILARDIAVIDFPGYGQSRGRTNASSLVSSADYIVNYFSSQPDTGNILIAGYSMGTGPAVFAASNNKVSGLILCAPYYDTIDLYNNVVNIFHGPMKVLISHRINSFDAAKNVSAPVVIIAGIDDKIVPFESSEKLGKCFGSCRFIPVSNTSHGELVTSPEFLSAVNNFILKSEDTPS